MTESTDADAPTTLDTIQLIGGEDMPKYANILLVIPPHLFASTPGRATTFLAWANVFGMGWVTALNLIPQLAGLGMMFIFLLFALSLTNFAPRGG